MSADDGARYPRKLSAIATFSTLVSSPTPGSSPTRAVARKTPEWRSPDPRSLPTEILRMIFQFAFESCVDSEDGVEVSWLDEDPLSPFLFPYSFACVCFRWFRILITIPVYWTRIVIPLDAIAVSLHAARVVLKWAGSRPLSIIVTRHHDASQAHDSEHAAVGRAVELLRPHFDHIRSLSFDVEYTSSIPRIWRESGQASHLKTLTLLGRSPAVRLPPSSQGLAAGDRHECRGTLEVPELHQVTFGFDFFKHTLMAHSTLANWFRHVTSLSICGNAGRSAVSLYRFLSVICTLSALRQLTVENIHFDDHAPYPNLLMLRPTSLCLRNITGKTALRGILTRPPVESGQRTHITIVDCDVYGFREPDPGSSPQFFSSINLTLASMNPTATIDDLVCRWNGEGLTVINCPRVSRAFLDALHGETAPMRLSRLDIVDCDNFNAGDLISLVRSRETQAGFSSLMGVDDDDSFTAVAELRVRGRGPPISVKRARWLAEHVETFVWDTVAKDGFRYAWDEAAERLWCRPLVAP